MSKSKEFVQYLNDRIAKSGYNERQVEANRILFTVMEGRKFDRIVEQGLNGNGRNSYAFVDKEGNIYKTAGWKAPAKGVRATVDDVVSNNHPFFKSGSFDQVAYSTSWLYA